MLQAADAELREMDSIEHLALMLNAHQHWRRRVAEQPSAGLAVVYETRRQRTLAMTLAAIAAVQKAAQPISMSSIVAASRRIDPAGRGYQ